MKEPRGRVRFLSDEGRGRLLEACRESADPLLYPLVVLAISTGARRGELLGLRWADVDLAGSPSSLLEPPVERFDVDQHAPSGRCGVTYKILRETCP